ncbi:MAG: glycosyltransferase [Oscillospiraceae bacterium]|nr:glycosyltransferase [Oscillospiraceae bacterium]
MPKISIIVPVYKVEPYLRRCVDSILAQTFKDFELILVDDGSPDTCGKICDEYAEIDPRIHAIHQENGGLSAARNAGIDWSFEKSSSSWIAFVDSDDWVHPDYLKYLYRAAVENDVKISICDYEETEGQETELPCFYKADRINWESIFIHNNVRAVVAWNKLYAKELFDSIRFPVGKLHEDEFLTYRLLDTADTVVFIPLALYYYFQNPEGITKSAFSLKRMDSLEALEERVDYFDKKGNEKLAAISCMALLNLYVKFSGTVESCNRITQDECSRIQRDLRRRARRSLCHYGRKYLPFRDYMGYYDFAFPEVMPGVRWCMKTVRWCKKRIKQ